MQRRLGILLLAQVAATPAQTLPAADAHTRAEAQPLEAVTVQGQRARKPSLSAVLSAAMQPTDRPPNTDLNAAHESTRRMVERVNDSDATHHRGPAGSAGNGEPVDRCGLDLSQGCAPQ